MRRAFRWLVFLAIVGVATGLYLTRAQTLDPDQFSGLEGDPKKGEQVFLAAGCASCHTAPESEDKLVLAGGQSFPSDFGTFFAPNISSNVEHGIGAWSLESFANAVKLGVSPDGQHYYPAFPYTSYTRMTDADLVDLWAYMQTLTADASPSQAHDIAFPFNIRRSVGVWKLLYLDDGWVAPNTSDAELERGRYLVEALGHCAECHTPRDPLGGLDTTQWLAGAPNPSGRGRIPSLVPKDFSWALQDIAYYLETGFTPDFDSVGGHMVPVVQNFAQLPESDRLAVAAYIKALADP